MIKAVLFDLDGTLLHMNQEEFLSAYLQKFSRAVSSMIEPKFFIKSLLSATDMMIKNIDPLKTNYDIFWEAFLALNPIEKSALDPLIENFYKVDFHEIKKIALSPPTARRVVASAIELGFKTVIATNPVFPAIGIQARLDWANLSDLPFTLITSYEEFHFCKPHAEYYLEVADKLRLPPENCLMIGNDIDQDMINSGKVGMKTYLVKDQLISSKQCASINYSGTLDELALFLNKNLHFEIS